MEQFLELNYLPLPLLDASKEHYLKFEDVYGKPISDADQPSLVAVRSEKRKQRQKVVACCHQRPFSYYVW